MDWRTVRPEHIAAVGALMKANGYRSLSNYVSRSKGEHMRAVYVWAPQHELETRQGTRSVRHGSAPVQYSAALRLEELLDAQTGRAHSDAGSC